MRVFVFLIAAFALAEIVCAGWFSSDGADEDVSLAPGAGKAKKKLDLAELTKEKGWATLSSADFGRLVSSKKNRTYSVITFLTATDGCEPCQVVEEQFQLVAGAFRKQNPDHTGLYFVDLRLENSRQIFMDLQAKSLPTILHIPPVKRGRRDFLYDPKHDIHAIMTSQGWTASGIANFVFDRTSVPIDVPKAFLSHRHGGGGAGAARFSFLGVEDNTVFFWGGVFVVVLMILMTITRTWRNFFPYFFVILVVWYAMVSGLVYNIITEPPPYQTGRNKEIQYFHHSSHGQYGLEGFIMGSMVTGIAVVILLANEALPSLQKRIAAKQNSARKFVATLVLNVAALALMGFSYFIFVALKNIYKKKMGGYPL